MQNKSLKTSDAILAEDGLFYHRIEGFTPRPSQQALAACIENALEYQGRFIGESGTGTGKTYAYLVPLLLSNKKSIISTGTRHLQDQIYRKDIPQLREILSVTKNIALLKGRTNYLCLYRLEQYANLDSSLAANHGALLNAVNQWSLATERGDLSELAVLDDNSPIHSKITSNADNCLGQQCSFIDRCFVYKARKEALAADLVIINHHLFFADANLKSDGFGELLPHFDVIIFDEAHQLPETAQVFLGQTLSSAQVQDLLKDLLVENKQCLGAIHDLGEICSKISDCLHRLCVLTAKFPERGVFSQWTENPKVMAMLSNLSAQFSLLYNAIELARDASEVMEKLWLRCGALYDLFVDICERDQSSTIKWYERTGQSFRIHRTPVDISNYFQELLETQQKAWVFLSATLQVNGKFDYFRKALGLSDCDEQSWESPFDFQSNARLLIPSQFPLPSDPRFSAEFCRLSTNIIEQLSGRTLVLFTSYNMMNTCFQNLKTIPGIKVLLQGDQPKIKLIEEFKSTNKCVLMGTFSFWEGIDVKGPALSCVIIDKLPFASPGDPVYKARLQHIEENGGNPFMDLQIPLATMHLKQGVGRLIRDESDRGLLVITDHRIVNKGYGKRMLRNLPAMPVYHDFDSAEDFLRDL